jgi:hypothetical protein
VTLAVCDELQASVRCAEDHDGVAKQLRSSHSTMMVRRNTFFDRWASAQLGISADELSLAELERLPVPTDLPDGPHSEMGGEIPSVLDAYTESELLELAGLGDQLLDELPPLPKGYRPPPAPKSKIPARS